jgi:transcriptional regulator with XRE-family HTH domain
MALTSEQLNELRAVSAAATGNRVAAAIKLIGITQQVLADALGEHQPYISAVVRGKHATITLTKAEKFAEYFGCSIEDLFPPRARQAVAS